MLTEEAKILETFENRHTQQDYLNQITQPEFTSVCPKTGHPDFAKIQLNYIADKKCVELKSYKLYLQAFRNKGIFYEDITNVLADDLFAVIEPKFLQIMASFTPRGGISSVITVERGVRPAQI